MGNDRKRALNLALGLGFLLAGCSGIPPFNQREVVIRAPQPPEIVSSFSDQKDLRPCPQALMAQTQWLPRNMARLRLGFTKLQVVGIVGDPAHAETFSLSNGAVIEVLFYHTAETICRVAASEAVMGQGLMPMVFQDDRLIGYGPNYYRDFVVPTVRQNVTKAPSAAPEPYETGMPQARVDMREAAPLRAAPARRGRWEQEDLPTPPSGNYQGMAGEEIRNGYTDGMQSNVRPVNYYESPPAKVGRGDPLP